MTAKDEKIDFSETLFLPKTSFAMRAGLPEQEPLILNQWSEKKIYESLRNQSKGKEKFVLHDGPPYANGHLHIGHALNKILKDFVVRSQQMLNKDSSYIPGWDCHGLPIEWKIEEQYREKGLNKDEVDIIQFRKECREFASKWIDIQREEFIRLGVIGDWSNPYTTMSFNAESTIVKEFFKFLENGSLFRGSKPVMWSTVEKTALAEAEIEYKEHKSTWIYVKFPILESNDPDLLNASVVIWTTTPWTIPGNRAIAFGEDIKYSLFKVDDISDNSHAQKGDLLVFASDLEEAVKSECRIKSFNKIKDIEDISSLKCSHPFRDGGYDFNVKLYSADYVTLDQGTGLVHIAPGHGPDDYELGVKNNIDVPETVDGDGKYFDHVPIFAGKKIFNEDGSDAEANVAVIIELKNNKALVGKGSLRHSYPHSWRSKAPVIFRNTPQWFIGMEANELRKKALDSIEKVKWFPDQGKKRIFSMIENRPDWVVSRQRAWGVPLSIFYEKKTGSPLINTELNKKIIKLFAEEGSDAWFKHSKEEWLEGYEDPNNFEKVDDILDVWFDSGCTHAFVLEDNDEPWPASLYLEGTDQHRGWFHSSLLESCGTRGTAPYESVLTHGFVLHEDGAKMSKSSNNIVSPAEVIEKSGADILRLWVANSDFSEDLKIGSEIIKSNVDTYRRLRNTIRFILGNLSDFSEGSSLEYSDLTDLDKYILSQLAILEKNVLRNYEIFEYQKVFTLIFNFCTNELSSFYFDIRKDSLYCDSKSSKIRRSTQTVLDILFHHLLRLLAPILCFTIEEAWQSRMGSNTSIHNENFCSIDETWIRNDLDESWSFYKKLKRLINGAIEVERKNKTIGSSLEASVILFINDDKKINLVNNEMVEQVSIVSKIEIKKEGLPQNCYTLDDDKSIGVAVSRVDGHKCERCWKYFSNLTDNVCIRCKEVIE
jgi:isoleucyl-tRNA synthetase